MCSSSNNELLFVITKKNAILNYAAISKAFYVTVVCQ